MIKENLLKILNYVLNVPSRNLILRYVFIVKNHTNFIMIFKHVNHAKKYIINNVQMSMRLHK